MSESSLPNQVVDEPETGSKRPKEFYEYINKLSSSLRPFLNDQYDWLVEDHNVPRQQALKWLRQACDMTLPAMRDKADRTRLIRAMLQVLLNPEGMRESTLPAGSFKDMDRLIHVTDVGKMRVLYWVDADHVNFYRVGYHKDVYDHTFHIRGRRS